METTKCDACDERDTLLVEMVTDESGTYCWECYEAYTQESMREAMPYVRRQMAMAQDNSAYEWGDPKNTDYVEWAIEQADAKRG